jgi:3',5'-cyclic AMP phosphodiesterase CpdA
MAAGQVPRQSASWGGKPKELHMLSLFHKYTFLLPYVVVVYLLYTGTAIFDVYTILAGVFIIVDIALIIVAFAIRSLLKSGQLILLCNNVIQSMFRVLGFSPYIMIFLMIFDAPWQSRLIVAFLIPGYVIYLAIGYLPPSVLLKYIKRGSFGSSLSLIRLRHRSSRDVPLLVFAHASDTHLPLDKTIEGDINKDDANRVVTRSLSWLLERTSMILLTGDITDQGDQAEWEAFLSILESRGCQLDKGKLFVIPGNHDLSLSLFRAPGLHSTANYDGRAFRYMKCVLLRCPSSWLMLLDGKLTSVSQYLMRLADYLDAYEKYPPYPSIPGRGRPQEVIVPQELIDVAKRHSAEAWPGTKGLLCADFLELSYPMVMHQEETLLIIGLNSCGVAAKTITGSAIGWLGPGQLGRLRTLIADAGTRSVILLLHHHIGFPPEKREEFEKKHGRVQTDALTLIDADELIKIIATIDRCYVFHGHKHFPYHARLGKAVVISGQSVTYGPHERASGCAIYQLNQDWELVLAEYCPIISLG